MEMCLILMISWYLVDRTTSCWIIDFSFETIDLLNECLLVSHSCPEITILTTTIANEQDSYIDLMNRK